eukprot:scaffold76807_cov66-Phaeocystis_antarctica.AAC.3
MKESAAAVVNILPSPRARRLASSGCGLVGDLLSQKLQRPELRVIHLDAAVAGTRRDERLVELLIVLDELNTAHREDLVLLFSLRHDLVGAALELATALAQLAPRLELAHALLRALRHLLEGLFVREVVIHTILAAVERRLFFPGLLAVVGGEREVDQEAMRALTEKVEGLLRLLPAHVFLLLQQGGGKVVAVGANIASKRRCIRIPVSPAPYVHFALAD